MKACKSFKRFLSVLLSVAMVVGMITVTGPQKVEAAGETLITNGGFDTASAWVDQDGTAVPAQNKVDDVTVTDVLGHGTFENMTTAQLGCWSGATAVGEGVDGSTAMMQSGKGVNHYIAPTTNMFQANTTYTVRFQAKATTDTTWRCYVDGDAVVTVPSGKNQYTIIGDQKGTGEWAWYEYQFIVDKATRGQIGFQIISATGTLYFDNVTITYETVEPLIVQTDVLGHGTFENMTQAQLGCWSGTTAVGEGVDGSTAMMQSGKGVNYYIAPTTNMFQANTTYTVRFQAKATTDTTWRCYVDGDGAGVTVPSGNNQYTIIGDKKGTGEWAWYEFQFIANKETRGQIGFQIISTSGTLYFDNVTIFYEIQGVDETDVLGHGTFENMTAAQLGCWSGTTAEGEGVNGTTAMMQSGKGVNHYIAPATNMFQENITYTVKFQAKATTDTTWRCYVDGDAAVTVPSGENQYTIIGDQKGTGEWAWYEYQFIVDKATRGQIGFQIISTAGTLYFDNVTIFYETPAMKKTYTQGIGTCLNAEEDNVLSMKSYTEVKQAINMTSGVDYAYSFKVKSVNEGSNLTFGVQAGDTKQVVNVTSDWTEVIGTINLAAEATTFGFYRSGTGEVLIDDVVLTAAAVPTDHTPNLADDYIPDGVTNLIKGDFSNGSYTGFGVTETSYLTVSDGIAKFEINGPNTYPLTNKVTAIKGHTYVFSYYIWIQDANGIKLDMFQTGGAGGPVNTTGWKDNLWANNTNTNENYKATIDGQPLMRYLTTDTDGWKEIRITWTAQADATFILAPFYNYSTTGTATVYVDDMALYDTTPKEKGEAATIELAWMHYSEPYQTAFTGTFPYNTGSKVPTNITILVNGVEKTVGFTHDGNTLSSWMGENILSETELNEITIPANTTWNDSNGDGWFYIENDYTFYTQKLEGHWLTWVSEYDYPYGADVQYEDMGSGKEYMFTNTTDLTNDGMRGTFVVVGETDLTLGGGTIEKTGPDYATTKTLGDYHVKRTVGTELYDYTVALYKRGNAHDELNGGETTDVLDARDLVAVKKATKTGAATFGYARKKAADANVDGRVNSADASFLRNTLVNDWDIMNTTKGETVFDQGTMPIIGYGGPGVDTTLDEKTSDTDRLTDKSYSLISEMGFNALATHTVYADNTEVFRNWAYPALTLADQYGIKLYLSDPKVAAQDASNTVTPELLAQRAGQYSEFASFAGFYITDEPIYQDQKLWETNSLPLDYIKSPMQTMIQYSNMHSWLNLYPSWSTTLSYSISRYTGETSKSNYNKYLDRANNYGAEAILYDMYLRTNGYKEGSYKLDYEHFYKNMDWVRTKSASYGKPFQAFVQVGTDFYEKNEAKTERSDLTTKQEMFLEANAALAMGAKGLNYFNIMQSESFATNKNGTVDLYRNGVIDVNGEPNYGEGGTKGDGGTYNYVDAVTKINHYVAEIDEVLMNAKNHGVITTDAEVEEYISGAKRTSYGAVQSVSGDDAFVGCFDYYGKDAYLVVNKSVSTSRIITLDFGGVTKDYATTDMTLTTKTGSGTSLALTIQAGESVLVMLDYVEEEIEAGSDFDTAFRFVVASDIHMETANDTQAKRLTDMFDSAYAYAETQDYGSVDAVVLVGDIVNKGIASEYDELAKVLETANIKSETEVLALMGNHEWWTDKTTGSELYLEGIADIDVIQEKGLNWSKNIGGYQFIGMSPLVNDVYGDNIAWMAAEVDKAATSGKPVFTFQHHAVSDTIYGSENGGASPKNNETEALNAAYANHNQVINFSGHSHAPINTPTAINQTTYTQFTTGTLKYLTCDGSATVGTHPANNTNAAQFTIVEVSRDNKVRMLPYDEYADQFFAPLGNERADRIEYTVDVNDASNWLYTSARKDNDAAPYFANNADITISDVTFKAAQVTFDQAKDDTGVYAYDIECISPEETVTSSYRIYSEWYFSPMPSTLSYPVANLAANTTYTVSITPIDFFGKKGAAITNQFTTAKKTADDMLTLTLNSVDADNTWWFNVNNINLVASSYYKLPVTIDGTEGHVIIGKNSGTGRMVIWESFFPVYGAKYPTSSFKVTAGTEMQEVSSSGWGLIAGGDSVEIGNDLTIELVDGVWTVK